MRAAAAGKSTLGIPKSVGQQFVRETPTAQRSAFAQAIRKVRQRHNPGTRRTGY
jgi:hypothetical protein